MRTLLKFIAAFAITGLVCLSGMSQSPEEASQDTVIINFGNKSKIIIYADSKEDLEAMLDYDINAMLHDLSITIAEADEDVQYLKIEDESGERYLKDTTIVIKKETTNLKKEVGVRIGNYKVEVDIDELDEEEFENIEEDGIIINKEIYEEEAPLRTKHSFNVYLGMNSYTDDANYAASDRISVRPWGSWYVALSSILKTPVSGPLFLEWGVNVSWYNFKLEDENVRIVKGEDRILFVPAGTEIDGRKSKLTASFINASFVPMLDFSYGRRQVKSQEIGSGSVKLTKYKKQGFRIGAGVYAGYRLGSHTKFKFKEEGDSEKDKDSGRLYLNNFRYGARFQMGYKGLDLFFNYDLNNLFENNKGPEVNAFSFGIIL